MSITILIAIVAFSIGAALLLSVRTLWRLVAATLVVGLLAIACSRLAAAAGASLLLVDHVAVTNGCLLSWYRDKHFGCDRIFANRFEVTK